MEPQATRVLLIDDDEDYCILAREALSEISCGKFQLDWFASYNAGLAAMNRHEHDVYLLDYRLGSHNGLELLREAIGHGARAPIILLTGQGDRDVDLEAMKAGAADYLSKDRMDAYELERSIRYAIERRRNEEALRRMQDELEHRVQERTSELAKAIGVLRSEISERMRIEEELENSLREKEVLLREIHHRVKNNLQIVTSLLKIQSRHIKDEHAVEMFKETQNRVMSIAFVHEKLYRCKDLARIDFGDYLRALISHLLRSYGVRSVTPRIAVDGVNMGIDTVIPCALIVNELVTNSIKHAFPDGQQGEVAVELTAQEGELCLTVSDDGVGFAGDASTNGAGSIGLQIVDSLIHQLGAVMNVAHENGTVFQITFNDASHAPHSTERRSYHVQPAGTRCGR